MNVAKTTNVVVDKVVFSGSVHLLDLGQVPGALPPRFHPLSLYESGRSCLTAKKSNRELKCGKNGMKP